MSKLKIVKNKNGCLVVLPLRLRLKRSLECADGVLKTDQMGRPLSYP